MFSKPLNRSWLFSGVVLLFALVSVGVDGIVSHYRYTTEQKELSALGDKIDSRPIQQVGELDDITFKVTRIPIPEFCTRSDTLANHSDLQNYCLHVMDDVRDADLAAMHVTFRGRGNVVFDQDDGRTYHNSILPTTPSFPSIDVDACKEIYGDTCIAPAQISP